MCQKSDNIVEETQYDMVKYPEIDEQKIGKNPFTEQLVIEATRRFDSKAKVKDENGISIPASNVMEKAKSTKVYHSATTRDEVMSMSGGTQCMYLYIIYTLEPGDEWIRIYPEWYATKTGNKSLNTYKKAVQELISKGFLTLSLYKYVYWINPSKMFSGSRINKYPDNVLITNGFTGPEKAEPKYKVNYKS